MKDPIWQVLQLWCHLCQNGFHDKDSPRSARDYSNQRCIPGADSERAAGEEIGVRQAAGGDDDDLGGLRQHLLGADVAVEAQLDARVLAARDAPVDDADELAPARHAGGEAELAYLIPALAPATGLLVCVFVVSIMPRDLASAPAFRTAVVRAYLEIVADPTGPLDR